MEHPGVILGLVAMWVLFIVTWTIPAARRHEPHEALASISLGAFISLLALVYSGAWVTVPIERFVAVAVALQLAGLALIVGSFHSLRSMGRPTDSWEQTTVIVRSGVYRVIAHPMYLGVALWAASIGMGRFSTASVTLAGIVVVLAVSTSIAEDSYNLRKFGKSYEEYKRSLPLRKTFGKRPPAEGGGRSSGGSQG